MLVWVMGDGTWEPPCSPFEWKRWRLWQQKPSLLIASILFIRKMGIGRSLDRCMIAVSGRLGGLGSLLGPLELPSTEFFSLGGDELS